MSLQLKNNKAEMKQVNKNNMPKTTCKKQPSMITVIICLIAMFITMLTTFTLATSAVDVIPPRGKIEIKNTNQINGTNYISTNEVDVEISAIDNTSNASQIKYVLSTTPISDATEITESSWNTYVPGQTQKLTLANADGENTIYLALKDAAGNTSVIYKGVNVEYTIAYNANGGTDFTGAVATKAYYGMPFKVTTQIPTRENYYFVGWSTTAGAATPSYKRGEIIPANVFVGGRKTITLYAVWKQNANGNTLLSDVVEPGDYVNFPVSYDNVNGSIYDGWRVISKDVDLDGNPSQGTVNLVSAGTPLTYYHADNAGTSVTALTNNFLTTPFSDTANYAYRKSGFLSNKSLKEIFTNKYVETKTDGTPLVRAMNANDIYKATSLTSMQTEHAMGLNNSKYENLFANESNYYLAMQKDSTNLWKIKEDAYAEGGNSAEYGIRPVVQLKAGTTISGMDSQGNWKIHTKAIVEKPSVIGTYTYNENEQTVVLNNFDSNIMTVTGNKATNAGNYTAVVTLKDTQNYEWSDGKIEALNIAWTINARQISTATVTVGAIADQTYTGSVITPTPTVMDGSTALVKDQDYTLRYEGNTNVGTATVTVTGKGNYTGTRTITFKIVAKNINLVTIEAIADQTYTRSTISPLPIVKDGSATLVKDTEYSVSYSSNTNVGTATVTINGKGNYTGTKTTTFSIVAKNISSATIDSVSSQIWLGSPLTPTPAVKDGSVTLLSGTEYTYSYSNNNTPGTGIITVTGIGNYTGTKSVNFTILSSTYTVTLDQQSGAGGTTSVTATYNNAMPSITIPSRTGYIFGGYFTEINGSGTKYYNDDGSSARNYNITSDTTLYANWIEIPAAASFGYTGEIQTYTVPATGVYKLETSGAGGYGWYEWENSLGWQYATRSGYGGHSMGYKYLTAGQVIYIGVGGGGGSYYGGFNGGGNGSNGTAGGGGGATHMAFANGTLAQIGTDGNSGQVLLVAGGGGGCLYSCGAAKYCGFGGDGGGTEGSAGGNAPGGTQTSASSTAEYGMPGFGQGGHNVGEHSVSGGWTVGCGGGGGGWYGGAAGWPSGGNASSGGGGSGYIGGVSEFTHNGTTYSPSTTQGGGASSYGNGSAKITFISQ